MEVAKAAHTPSAAGKRTFFQRIKEPYTEKEIRLAVDFVSRLYGAKTSMEIPSSKVMWVPSFGGSNLTFSLLSYPFRFVNYLMAGYDAGYSPVTNTIRVHPAVSIRNAIHRRLNPMDLLVHECTHYLQPRVDESVVAKLNQKKWLAMCASTEGQAHFSMHEYQKARQPEQEAEKPKGFFRRLISPLEKLADRLFRFSQENQIAGMALAPIYSASMALWKVVMGISNLADHYANMAAKISVVLLTDPVEGLRILFAKLFSPSFTVEQRAQFVDFSPHVFMHFMNQYDDGAYFFSGICRMAGGPENAFRLVSEHPPISAKEIANPEIYMKRVIEGEEKRTQ